MSNINNINNIYFLIRCKESVGQWHRGNADNGKLDFGYGNLIVYILANINTFINNYPIYAMFFRVSWAPSISDTC